MCCQTLNVFNSNCFGFLLQPKYGGKIIDIVSRDVRTPEQQQEALDAVKNTIIYIVAIVVVGYVFEKSRHVTTNPNILWSIGSCWCYSTCFLPRIEIWIFPWCYIWSLYMCTYVELYYENCPHTSIVQWIKLFKLNTSQHVLQSGYSYVIIFVALFHSHSHTFIQKLLSWESSVCEDCEYHLIFATCHTYD